MSAFMAFVSFLLYRTAYRFFSKKKLKPSEPTSFYFRLKQKCKGAFFLTSTACMAFINYFFIIWLVGAIENSNKEVLTSQFMAEKTAILSSIEKALQNKEYRKALVESEKYIFISDDELNKLHEKVRIASILYKLESIPESNSQVKMAKYEELIKISPDNKFYLEKFEFYKVKATAKAKANAKAQAKKNRKEKIEKQFSPWDGSHTKLKNIIKQNMNDPDSFEHDKTVYWDKGHYLLVLTNFRGRNGFGGMARNYFKAKFTLNGDLMEIVESG